MKSSTGIAYHIRNCGCIHDVSKKKAMDVCVGRGDGRGSDEI